MAPDPALSVREGIDVRERTAELGLGAPETFAILPFNLVAAGSTAELMAVDQAAVIRRMVLPDVEVAESRIETDEPLEQLSQSWDGHLYLPTIHFTHDLLSDRWDAVASLIGLLAEYYATQAEAMASVPEDTAVEIAFNCEVGDGENVQFVFEDHPDRLDRVIERMADELDVPGG